MRVVDETSFQVVVPVNQSWPGEEVRHLMERCLTIIRQIKRHVDDVDPQTIRWTFGHVCSHCGRPWTETSATFNGGCCDEDCDDNEEGCDE